MAGLTLPSSPESAELSLDTLHEPKLVSHVKGVWERVKRDKQKIERRFLADSYQSAGIYPPDQLSKIQAAGGSEIYVRLTATKIRMAIAMIMDVFSNSNERPWELAASPYPDLPPDLKQHLEQQVLKEIESITLAYVQMSGKPLSPQEFNEFAQSHHDEMKDRIVQLIRDKAKERADRMERKVHDQMLEGGWLTAFVSTVMDLVVFGTGIMKAPVRKKKVEGWNHSLNGTPMLVVEDRIQMEFESVSPFDFYPDNDITDLDFGDTVEVLRLTRKELNGVLTSPGWHDENIKATLKEFGAKGHMEWLGIDTQRRAAENRSSTARNEEAKMFILRYMGSVQGSVLLEFGIPGDEDIDEDLDYDVEIYLCKNRILKAILNPDPLGKKGYFAAVYERVPGSFWGNGVSAILEDSQAMVNNMARVISNNAAFSSGPIVVYNEAMFPDGTNFNMEPWMKIAYRDEIGQSTRKAVEFFQPPNELDKNLAVLNKFMQLGNDQPGVPNLPQISSKSTSSGTAMMLNASLREMKLVILNIDRDLIAPCIEWIVRYNNRYDEDDSIKGDMKVTAKGASSLVTKELMQIRINEFLQSTNNPTDAQIVGAKGRSVMLRQAAKGLGLDVDEIIPPPHVLSAMPQQLGQSQSPKQGEPPQVDASGQKAGGQDMSLIPGGGAK